MPRQLLSCLPGVQPACLLAGVIKLPYCLSQLVRTSTSATAIYTTTTTTITREYTETAPVATTNIVTLTLPTTEEGAQAKRQLPTPICDSSAISSACSCLFNIVASTTTVTTTTTVPVVVTRTVSKTATIQAPAATESIYIFKLQSQDSATNEIKYISSSESESHLEFVDTAAEASVFHINTAENMLFLGFKKVYGLPEEVEAVVANDPGYQPSGYKPLKCFLGNSNKIVCAIETTQNPFETVYFGRLESSYLGIGPTEESIVDASGLPLTLTAVPV
ncbi:hypothetical protein ABW20_dc0101344 [Dactylellina cionopaga]|nr:hypothetical protein ABW20_dc0101344 [Dactylellina cionopaga]